MLHYALLFYLIWGVSTPDRIPDEDRLKEFPGTFDQSDLRSVDQVLIDLFAASPSFNSKRFSSVLLINAVVFSFAVLLSVLTLIVPYALAFIVLVWFGPVVTVSATWSWLGAGCAVVSLITALLSRFWISSVIYVSRAAIETRGVENFEEMSSSTIASCLLLADSGQISENVNVNGVVIHPRDIGNKDIHVSIRFAVATYHLFCPTPMESYSTASFSLVVMVLMISKWSYRHLRLWLKGTFWAFRWAFIASIFSFCGSNRAVGALADLITFVPVAVLWPLLKFVYNGDFSNARHMLRLVVLLAILKALNFAFMLNLMAPLKRGGPSPGVASKDKLRAAWNNAIMDFTRMLDNISIPNFIRSLPDRFDREAINEGQAILADLGWPVAPEVLEGLSGIPSNQSAFEKFGIGQTSIRQGIKRLELSVAAELSNLDGLAPQYKRSEQYATYEAELESISRYFEEPKLDIPDLPIDDIWPMIKDIFENSKLTPFSYILKKWEKKYGLGPFWGKTNPKTGRWSKLSRKAFIQQIGGMGKMVKLWADTFKVAHVIPAVSPVSIKSEALPEKKWRNGLVRTVIGAPIVHYISSTIWNFAPNHNFQFWSTNIKIGMPLNGINLSKLIRQHATYTYHFGGDFSAFDSTVTGKIAEMIAKVRKKGFERHRDFAKICFLIDANYKGLLNMPLMTTSTGDLYRKLTGLSTGHSSTGMDNSLAVTILYILAWKHITGLSAHEFRHYCKLSNYGDDHLLSWLATAPAGWNPENIMKFMKRIGVDLRDEFPKMTSSGVIAKKLDDYKSLSGLAFLSKQWREPTTTDRLEMASAGVDVPEFLVFHDPVKLVGKAYAPTKDAKPDPNYRIKRLVSYLYLTAHHRELYDKILYDIELVRTRNGKRKAIPSPVPIPTYNEVLASWYDPETVRLDPDDTYDEDAFAGKVLDYSLDGLADTLVNILSVVPDVLNPAIYNMGYSNWLISMFGSKVCWPIELIRRANCVNATGALSQIGKRTFYDFLFEVPTLLIQPVDASDSSLLVRHWIFTLLRGPNLTPQVLKFLTWADKKVTETNFILNGFVQPYVKRLDVPVIELVLIALLSFVHIDGVPGLLRHVRLPTASSAIEYATGYATNVMWSKIPANMKQAHQGLSTLDVENFRLLVVAPTGTGKSTTFVNYVFRYFGYKYTRVYLVVPRSLLVTSLAPYLRQSFGLPAIEVTEGHPDVPSCKLVITTPQEVLLHERWLSEGSLILVDECHVLEPAVLALLHVLERRRHPHVMMTATPSADNLSSCTAHVPLQIARTWSISDDHRAETKIRRHIDTPQAWWADYRSRVLDLVRARTLMRFLVFVPGKHHATELSTRIGRRTCVITATNKVIDPEAEVFIATAVADVGLTIPDVHWVISSNVTRSMSAISDVLLWTKVNPLLKQQRRGRTGRTSNGTFTFFEYSDLAFVSPEPVWTHENIGLEVLKSTGDPNLVAQFWPSTIASMWGHTGDIREVDHLIDSFKENAAVVAKALEADNQKTYRTTVDGLTEVQNWHIAGNTLPVPLLNMGEGRADNPVLQLNVEQGWRFICGAAHWAASHGILLSKDQIKAFLYSEGVSAKNFIKFMTQPVIPMAPPSQASLIGETTRFGARPSRVALTATPDGDIMEGFAYVDNPVPLQAAPVRVATPEPVEADVTDGTPVAAQEQSGPVYASMEDELADLLGSDDEGGFGMPIAAPQPMTTADALAEAMADMFD